jgi:hypothetical protein
VADISYVVAESATVLRVYATQWGSIARTLRMRRYGAAFYGWQRQIEAFWELPAERYQMLHGDAAGAMVAVYISKPAFLPVERSPGVSARAGRAPPDRHNAMSMTDVCGYVWASRRPASNLTFTQEHTIWVWIAPTKSSIEQCRL